MSSIHEKLQVVQRRIGALYRQIKSNHLLDPVTEDNNSGLGQDYLPLHAFLNGEDAGNDCDGDFRRLQEALGMYVGLFVFINPEAKPENRDDQMPFYLWGARFFEKSTSIKPSFQLPILYRDGDWRCALQGEDFHIRFQQEINEFYRKKQKFDHQDFITPFINPDYINKRNQVEQANGWLYISSGEIDHSIFQLLAMYVVSVQRVDVLNLDSKIQVDLLQLTLKDRLKMFWEEFTEKHSQPNPAFFKAVTSFIKSKNGQLLLVSKGRDRKALRTWIREWGFMDSKGRCTEKFMAVIEFFYFLVSWKNDGWFDLRQHFLHIGTGTNSPYFDDAFMEQHQCISEFRSRVKTLMDAGQWNRGSCSQDIINLYLQCISAWTEEISDFVGARKKFVERARTRTFIHFVVRCTQGYFKDHQNADRYKGPEKWCRAQFVIPILHNPLRTTDASLSYAGYFIAHLHDADSKEKSYFNWYTLDGQPNPSAKHFFDEVLPSICILAQTLGQIEIEEVFYKGVMRLREADITSYARQAAAADIKVASSAHIEGSHITSGAGSADIGHRLDSLVRELRGSEAQVNHNPLSGAFCDYLNKRFLSHRQARDEYLGVGGSGSRTLHFYRDLVLPYVTNTIRMDRIGRDAGYGFRVNVNKGYAESPIRINVLIPGPSGRPHHDVTASFKRLKNVWKPSIPVQYPNAFPFYVHPRKSGTEDVSSKFRLIYHGLHQAFEDPDINRDIDVTVGATQAFGSLMDCYLRNVIKHSKRQFVSSWDDSSDNFADLRITLQLEEQPDHYEVYLYDNQSFFVGKKRFIQFLKDQFLAPFASISMEGSTRDNRGLKEMRLDAHAMYYSSPFDEVMSDALELVAIAAPHTQKRALHIAGPKKEVFVIRESEDFDAYQLSAAKVSAETDEAGPIMPQRIRFGYKLRLAKPKSILYIGPPALVDSPQIDHLSSISDFMESAKTHNLKKTVASYEFAILHPETLDAWLAQYANDQGQGLRLLSRQLPLRTIVCGRLPVGFERWGKKFHEAGAASEQMFREDTVHGIRIWCWQTWLGRWGVSRQNRVFMAIALGNQEAAAVWNVDPEEDLIRDPLFDLQLQLAEQNNAPQPLIPQPDRIWEEYGFVHIWARHGKVDHDAMQEYGFGDTGYPDRHPRRLWYSTLSGAQKDYYAISHPPLFEGKVDHCFLYQLIEAHLMRIIIIDERLASRANRPWDAHYKGFVNQDRLGVDEKLGYKAFAAAGLTVPRGIEGGGPLYGEKTGLFVKTRPAQDKPAVWVRYYSPPRSRRNDETLVRENDGKKYRELRDYFLNEADIVIVHRTFVGNSPLHEKLDDDVIRCYITSGGGLPALIHAQQLPLSHFIGFHSLHQCFTGTDVSKLHLISLL